MTIEMYFGDCNDRSDNLMPTKCWNMFNHVNV